MDETMGQLLEYFRRRAKGHKPDVPERQRYHELWTALESRPPEERLRTYRILRQELVFDPGVLMTAIYWAIEDIVLARYPKAQLSREQWADVFHEFGEDELAALYLDEAEWERQWAHWSSKPGTMLH